MEHRISTPLTKDKIKNMHCGDIVYITGTLYTARDAAHKRLCNLLNEGKQLPFDVENSIIYYVGPTPAKPKSVIGSAGPTTSYRMDAYAPALIEKGLTGMIGKGKRDKNVINAMKKHGAVYFGAVGGAGAYLAKCIEKCELVAYEDLQSEAIRKLEVKDFPVYVIIDMYGANLYETGVKEYLKNKQ